MNESQRTQRRAGRVLGVVAITGLIALFGAPRDARAGVDVVRMEGVIGDASTPGAVKQLTLAIGTKSVPFSVLSAQKVSGAPAQAPEIFSALGPGPPPVRVEGRDTATEKITSAAPGTRATIVGNFDAGNAFLTLMDVEIGKSAGAE